MKKNNKKTKYTKGEKFLYYVTIGSFALAIVTKIFCGAIVGHLSVNVEKVKYNISEHDKKIESLNMQINELTAFTEIKNVVKNMGLSYNNQNVIIIED